MIFYWPETEMKEWLCDVIRALIAVPNCIKVVYMNILQMPIIVRSQWDVVSKRKIYMYLYLVFSKVLWYKIRFSSDTIHWTDSKHYKRYKNQRKKSTSAKPQINILIWEMPPNNCDSRINYNLQMLKQKVQLAKKILIARWQCSYFLITYNKYAS